MARYTRSASLPGAADVVWSVVGEVTGTENEHLAVQEIVSGSGEGMIRRCVDTDGHEWTETCSIWEPGRRYRFDVDVDAHPLPMRTMSAEVAAEPANAVGQADSTTVSITFEYRSKLGPVIDQMAKVVLRKIARENFATWRAQLPEPV